MQKEIINKVEESGLIQFDLEAVRPKGERVLFDLKGWLFEELILREKDFREKIASHDWNQYQDKFVAITCSADAIVPTWAFMLVASHLESFAAKTVLGDLATLESALYREAISKLNPDDFRGGKVVIKGCGENVPLTAYVDLTNFLKPFAKSIMFGEPCSTVPVFKRKS